MWDGLEDRPSTAESDACLKDSFQFPSMQEEETAARMRYTLVPAGADRDGPPAPTAWLGLRALPVSSWFGSGGELPPVALADLGLAMLSRIFVVLDYLVLGAEAK